MKRRLADAAEFAGHAVRRLPGLLALACAVVGIYLIAGLGWALLAAVPFLLLMDRATP